MTRSLMLAAVAALAFMAAEVIGVQKASGKEAPTTGTLKAKSPVADGDGVTTAALATKTGPFTTGTLADCVP